MSNIKKTKVVLFKSARQQTVICSFRIVKFIFFIKIDEKINWKKQISDLSSKLNSANAILSKSHFVGRKTLKAIHQVIFKSHLHCFSLVWAQNSNSKLYLPKEILTAYTFSELLCLYVPLIQGIQHAKIA